MMGKVKEHYKENKQEDDRMYNEWKKESIKLLPIKTNPTIVDRIKKYFKSKTI